MKLNLHSLSVGLADLMISVFPRFGVLDIHTTVKFDGPVRCACGGIGTLGVRVSATMWLNRIASDPKDEGA